MAKITRKLKLYRIIKKLNAEEKQITLCVILDFIKRKFKLEELTPQVLLIIGLWRYNKNDLRHQFGPCVDLVYYFVFVQLPKPKKQDGKSKHPKEA